ncbi:restriction endonuclease [Paludisphaera rhizosphaerae]|nr:restriction endonuclease [Paludisphaera rhizosphaerae]
MQSIIVPGEQTNEGVLIESVTLVWRELARQLAADPSLAFRIDAHVWEGIVAAAYKAEGFDEVILTPRSGDYGRDVIAIKKDFGSIRFIDQVKRYNPEKVIVTADDVRALVGVLLSDSKATKAFVTTTSDFAPGIMTDPFISQHIPYRLVLQNGSALRERINRLAVSEQA